MGIAENLNLGKRVLPPDYFQQTQNISLIEQYRLLVCLL